MGLTSEVELARKNCRCLAVAACQGGTQEGRPVGESPADEPDGMAAIAHIPSPSNRPPGRDTAYSCRS
jgi:hypothetical protein